MDFGIARIHIPIVTNDKVEFTVSGKTVKMAAGECWFLDTSYSHSARNLGAAARIHLVLDCVVNDFVAAQLQVDYRKGR